MARMNDLVPEKTLDEARDGALARTATTKISEIRSNPQGFPGRDIEARNVGGGILDTRLIYAPARASTCSSLRRPRQREGTKTT